MSTNPPSWPPNEWLDRLRRRDPDAWETIYTSCLKICNSLLSGWPSAEIDPQDAAQQVFKEVLENLDSWDHVVSIKVFVNKRARWRCISLMREAQWQRQHRELEVNFLDADGQPTSRLDRVEASPPLSHSLDEIDILPITDDPEKAAVYAALQACIKKLVPIDREILSLRMIGWANREIGPRLSRPLTVNNVGVRYNRIIHVYLPTCLDRSGFSSAVIGRIWSPKGLS